MPPHILAIDQGTTSTRTILFAADLSIAASAQQEFAQYFPSSGWVEHDPEDLWRTTVATMKRAIADAGIPLEDIADIVTGQWSADLCGLLDVPMSILPEVRDSSGDFGQSDASILGRSIPIRGIAGDQQAATVGQACFSPGMMKATYGTGCFALLNTGDRPVASKNRLLTTIACQLNGKRTYALEGAIFVAGSAVQWLRDGLGVIRQ